MKTIIKCMVFAVSLGILVFLSACGGSAPQPRDFYSMEQGEPAPPENQGTIWLGMVKEEQEAAIGPVRDDIGGLRLRYRDGVLKSMTAYTVQLHPVGLTFAMTQEEIKAYYAADPEVTITEEPNLLTATKTIDGTLYYVRVVFYNDGEIKEINQTVDPTIDELVFPKNRL